MSLALSTEIIPRQPAAIFWRMLLLVVMIRLCITVLLIGWEVQSPAPMHPRMDHYHQLPPDLTLLGQLTVKWDSYWYLNIVQYGYQKPISLETQSNIAFAPLYPATIRLSSPSGCSPAMAGVIISILCYLILLYYLFQLGCIVHSASLGGALMIFISVFPSSWVFQMVYSEAMFCATVAAFFNYHLRGRRAPAAICLFLLPLIRFAGLTFLPALGCWMLYQSWKSRRLSVDWALLFSAFAGVVTLMVVYQLTIGDPLLFIQAKHAWAGHRGLLDRFPPLLWAFRDRLFDDPLTYFYLPFYVIYWLIALFRLRVKMDLGGWFVLWAMLLYLFTPDPSGVFRFMLPLLPLHVWLVERILSRPWLQWCVYIFCILMLIPLTRLYLIWRVII
ncbi:MAG: hypothetical protein HJJLKODD_00255 [Phycisphaerae bacterium]|nr:hypothetical protein [Phycisphaerae bacterium]